MNARRYPRTCDEAFGPYQRSSQCPIQPMDEPMHRGDVLVIKASALCAVVLIVLYVLECLK